MPTYSLAHPFFSLNFFYGADDFFFTNIPAGIELSAIPHLREWLCNTCLEPWTIYEPLERLQRAAKLAQRLSGLHLALPYHRIIPPGMEQRWENARMLPHHLRKLFWRQA